MAVHDRFGQAVVGMPLAYHHHPELARPLKPGSTGRPVPGWSLTVLADDKAEPAGSGVLGRVAIDVAASQIGLRGRACKSLPPRIKVRMSRPPGNALPEADIPAVGTNIRSAP
ncbi:hypothetical protein [Streptomyces canus]|uniref:hypothetical protein n=1 Tax=Streptomyces canus TaxID=58343 RepID=UPI0033BFB35B